MGFGVPAVQFSCFFCFVLRVVSVLDITDTGLYRGAPRCSWAAVDAANL